MHPAWGSLSGVWEQGCRGGGASQEGGVAPQASLSAESLILGEGSEWWPWPSRSLPDHRPELPDDLASRQRLRKAMGQGGLRFQVDQIPRTAQRAGAGGADPRGDTRVSVNSHPQPCHLADLAKQIIFQNTAPQPH